MAVVMELFYTVGENPLLLIIFFLSVVFFVWRQFPSKGPNPFLVDATRPLRPLVISQEARDKVLKQGFSRKKVPDQLDAVVIGSGAGGLTTAAILSKAGHRVLVLEQHDQAGGACHTFVENGFEFDVGIHYIGEVDDGTIGKTFVEQVTDGQLQWCRMDDEYDVCVIEDGPDKRRLFPMRAGSMQQWGHAIMEKFPDEIEAINKYMKFLEGCKGASEMLVMAKLLPKWLVKLLSRLGLAEFIWPPLRMAKRTTQEILDEITSNKLLQAVLACNFGDYGTPPWESSCYMHATVTNHYMASAYYPRGGSSEFAFSVVPVIERAGGRVLVRAPVTRILMEKGKAVGVRVNKGGEDIDIYAKLVISNAGVPNTFLNLLPPELVSHTDEYQLVKNQTIKSSVCCMQLFVGLRGTSKELGLKAANFWVQNSLDTRPLMEEFSQRSLDSVTDTDIPRLFISFPSAKDTTYNDRYQGKSACIVISVGEWSWFEPWQNERVKKRGEDYEAMKKDIGDRMWQQALRLFPQLEDKVEYFEVGTPLSHKYYLEYPEGGMYGMDNPKERYSSPELIAKIRATSNVPGLMLVGQDVTSCGFLSAMFSALLCTSQILKRNLFNDLTALHNKQLIKP